MIYIQHSPDSLLPPCRLLIILLISAMVLPAQAQLEKNIDEHMPHGRAYAESMTEDDTRIFAAAEEKLLKDIILVLDNSGSMKNNDPEFLAKQAIAQFIGKLDENTRLAINIFDEDTKMAAPLTGITPSSRDMLLNSLSQINYKGLYTNSPAAMESAIYKLKNEARETARKIIVFMTDGIVDTGNTARDLEKTKWLKQELAADAVAAGIKIFGIAFTENADFELIQSLAQKTGGEYYRVLSTTGLQATFRKFNTLINQADEPRAELEPETTDKMPDKITAPIMPQPVSIVPPIVQPQLYADTERQPEQARPSITTLLLLLLATLMIILGLLKIKHKISAKKPALEAYLNDLNDMTGHAPVALGGKPIMLGRIPGKDTKNLDYLVIPEATIGRRHALIEYKDFSYWIIDQSSINGTFVNGKKVTSRTRLNHGDSIRLHKVKFQFIIPEMDDAGMTVVSNINKNEGKTNDGEITIAPDFTPPKDGN